MADSCRILITRINAENYPNDGIQPGDYITGVNGRSVYDIRKDADKYNHFASLSADQYAPAYISFPGKSVTYTVEREGHTYQRLHGLLGKIQSHGRQHSFHIYMRRRDDICKSRDNQCGLLS